MSVLVVVQSVDPVLADLTRVEEDVDLVTAKSKRTEV